MYHTCKIINAPVNATEEANFVEDPRYWGTVDCQNSIFSPLNSQYFPGLGGGGGGLGGAGIYIDWCITYM